MLFVISPGLTGHYVDIVVSTDGSGVVQWAELVAQIDASTGLTRLKRVITHTIARFDSLSDVNYCTVDPLLAARFAPIPFDERARLRATYAHLKSKKPLPGWVIPGVSRVDLSGGFRLVDDFSGDILFDSAICGDVDHYRDFAQD